MQEEEERELGEKKGAEEEADRRFGIQKCLPILLLRIVQLYTSYEFHQWVLQEVLYLNQYVSIID